MTPGQGFEPGPHWWEASAITTAPSLSLCINNYYKKVNELNYFYIILQINGSCTLVQCMNL